MSRYVNEFVTVIISNRRPARFLWHEYWHVITGIIEFWREVGEWWNGEHERDVFIVTDAKKGRYELLHDRVDDKWLLYRIMD